MTKELIDLKLTNGFSDTFLNYIGGCDKLKPFYNELPSAESIFAQIKKRGETPQNVRNDLFDSLSRQYKSISKPNLKVEDNITALKSSKTFTITTGHQLNLGTGPLFLIYKIVTAINTAKKLNEKYPDYKFIPVYWMATEDHDLEEINHFHFFGKKYIWNTKQEGATGSMSTEGIADLLNDLPEQIPLLERAYKELTIADAMRHCMNALFGDEGLLVLDANCPKLKVHFKPIMEKELFERKSQKIVEKQGEELRAEKFQTLIHPRSINLFYLENDIRQRIVFENNKFKVLNQDISFSEEEMKSLLKHHPEKLSPNVVLRPIYQETILPNLCYVGGPSELVYWFQLHETFALYKTDFPILLPRNFGMILRTKLVEKWKNFGVETKDLFKNFSALKIQYVEDNNGVRFNVDQEKEQLKNLFKQIGEKVTQIDGSLSSWIGAEHNKVDKSFENIEKRVQKLEEKKFERELIQIQKILEKLFPEQSLQERFNNFFEFEVNEKTILKDLLNQLDPFDYKFMNVLMY